MPLHTVAEVRTGLAKGKPALIDPVEVPYLRVANVQDGHFDLGEIKTILVERSAIKRYQLHAGDVLMTEGGDFDKLGRGAVWSGEISPCLHQNHLFVVRPDSSVLNAIFLAALSSSHYGRAYFESCAKRSTNLASINSSQLKEFPVVLPPYSEQAQIACILDTWDAAIATTKQLLANSRRQMRDLMQGLLTGHRTFGTDCTLWAHADFDQVFERVTRKNTAGDQNVLTISGQHGLISQREYFSRVVASDDLSGYTHLSTGDFAYNKSSSNGYPMGAIKPLVAYDSGVVSSLYICFRIRPGVEADEDFFSHYFDAGMLNDEITGIAQEGARNHGLLNVSVKEFFKLKLRVPPLEDQRRIAEVLNTAQEEIRNIEGQLERLKTEKRALMADLLTGKRRVRVPDTTEEAQEPA
ncbi:MAG TPA: restriction endonuclease subunit S [Burkholderiaceae bacterium]|nr:restriction endonuclease subunit S [Burkholderiaceae bacterium]